MVNSSADRASERPAPLSVSRLIELFNFSLEQNFPSVNFIGEISSLKPHANGHLYLTLKDQSSKVDCVMWRSSLSALKFKPDVGMLVECVGKPTIWSGAGKFQVVLSRLTQAGEGLLQKKFLELRAKLEKQGYFSPERKRELPFFPRAVGIVTSRSGAVIHDIMVKFAERMPCLPAYLVDVRVQGEGAAEEIAAGVEKLSASGLVDVIIVARGGGSLEDLWAFNEEAVVKAVFASKVPVVSGVGHEVDVTLCDLAADVRAPTPTAAAEIVVPLRSDLLAAISDLERRLVDYERWFRPLELKFDELVLRLEGRVKLKLEESRTLFSAAELKLRGIRPDKLLAALLARVDLLAQKLRASSSQVLRTQAQALALKSEALPRAFSMALKQKALVFEKLAARMAALDPRQVLKRGFSLVEKRGELVRSAKELRPDDLVDLVFAADCAQARIVTLVEKS